jgi:hypothetical protein
VPQRELLDNEMTPSLVLIPALCRKFASTVFQLQS